MSTSANRARYRYKAWEIDLRQRELRAGGRSVPLGGRAFDTLEVLVLAGGAMIAKSELLERVWRNLNVAESSLPVVVHAIRQALGSDRDLLRTHRGIGYRLLGDWVRIDETASELPADPPVVRHMPAGPGNLPLEVSELVGRSTALVTLHNLLSAYRVVTLVGPGGIGKTRLALDAARGVSPDTVGVPWFVELAPLSDPGLVPSVLATTLGLASDIDRISIQSVASAIGGRHILLVIDNCEHVLDAVAQLVEVIVRYCPRTSILATSRELLRIDGEYVYHVPALSVPADRSEGLAELEQYGAVQLFIARVLAVRSDFRRDQEALSIIGAICRRLDGIPLAIELAAARAGILGLQAVLSRLHDRFALLTAGRRTALPRHQTLRAALDWSYDLLLPSERRLFRILGVFPAGFSFEAVAFVMEGFGAGQDTVDGISSMVDKSLLVLDRIGSNGRWRLLETTRLYAHGKLIQEGEAAKASRLHASFYRDLVGPVTFGSQSPEYRARLLRLGIELDHVRAALEWAFSPPGDVVLGVELTSGYVPVWLYLYLMEECADWMDRTLERLTPDLKLDARFTMQVYMTFGAAMLYTMGSIKKVATVIGQAIELADRLGDIDTHARALWALVAYHGLHGEQRAALQVAHRLQALAEKADDEIYLAISDRLLGTSLHYTGDQLAARPCLERMLAHYAPSDRMRQTTSLQISHRGHARTTLARVLWLQGFVEQGLREAQATVRDAETSGLRNDMHHPLTFGVSIISLVMGDLETAQESVERLVALAISGRPSFWDATVRCVQASLLIRRGELGGGIAMMRPALDTCRRTGYLTSHGLFLGILAEALGGLLQLDDALATIRAAIAWCHQTGECWCLPELHRTHGCLLLMGSYETSADLAETCFNDGISLSRQQGALFWELRSVTSLARLLDRKGRRQEGYSRLSSVYSEFTEGFWSVDLQAARRVLEDIIPVLESHDSRGLGDAGGDVIHDAEQKDVRYGRSAPPSI